MALSSEAIDDFKLIRHMAYQEADFEAARDAWGHFYMRHHHAVTRVAIYQYGHFVPAGAIEDFIEDGFIKAFDRAKSFNCEEHCTVDLQQRKVRAWVIRIIQNIVRDSFEGQLEVLFVEAAELDELSGVTEQSNVVSTVPESERLRLLKSGFVLLSEFEKTILLATMAWWRPDETHQRMPHSAMDELAKQIGKSPENIRKIRSRAMKKLETYINNNLPHENAK
jgi:RNA polymerase sigma factor (sigma-70 family)